MKKRDHWVEKDLLIWSPYRWAPDQNSPLLPRLEFLTALDLWLETNPWMRNLTRLEISICSKAILQKKKNKMQVWCKMKCKKGLIEHQVSPVHGPCSAWCCFISNSKRNQCKQQIKKVKHFRFLTCSRICSLILFWASLRSDATPWAFAGWGICLHLSPTSPRVPFCTPPG